MTTDSVFKLELIERIVEGFPFDENLGDTTERFETILYVASSGQRGKDWGHAGMARKELEAQA